MSTATPNPTPCFDTLRAMPLADVRGAIAAGRYLRHTAGLAAGYLQANLVILPGAYADAFTQFCARNPKPCPLVGVSAKGSPHIPSLGAGVDLRCDVPSYNIYRHGVLAEQTHDLTTLWQDDFTGFALGCSFTFENALARAGIPVWHVEHDKVVPMYRSNIALEPAGVFAGNMVVSLRVLADAHVAEAAAISAHFPWAHGAPVHMGDPAAIGIADMAKPDWGDAPPTPCPPGFTPCFWACGVTPQAAVLDAGLPLVITHTPGHMLITEIAEDIMPPAMTGKDVAEA